MRNAINPARPAPCLYTFATYHARYFRDLAALQQEMGHTPRGSSILVMFRPSGEAGQGTFGIFDKKDVI